MPTPYAEIVTGGFPENICDWNLSEKAQQKNADAYAYAESNRTILKNTKIRAAYVRVFP